MSQPIFQVDAFTDEPYAGNPAGVCILRDARDESWMRHVAREMNVAETAFLTRSQDDPNTYDLRWFTPTVEVDLCGHATLASAHILWETGTAPLDSLLSFHTRSGVLTAANRNGFIELDFPAEPAEMIESVPPEITRALGVPPRAFGENRLDYMVEVADEDTLRSIAPDLSLIKTFTVRGIIVTSRSLKNGYDFVSRFFAPGAGVDEDPVTGSAHCCLGPYWQRVLGKDTLVGYQASARGGVVHLQMKGDRVLLSGKAVTVLRGEILY